MEKRGRGRPLKADRQYKTNADKQRAYRERKARKDGLKQVCLSVPLDVYEQIKGNPNVLLDAYYVELPKDKEKENGQ